LRYFLFVILILVIPVNSVGKTLHREKVYQQFWCGRFGGQTEVVLSDRSRVDCLTGTYAIEVDFADNWAEAIGQALFYGAETGKKPGILIIMENPQEGRFLKKLRFTIKKFNLPIRVWVIRPDDIN